MVDLVAGEAVEVEVRSVELGPQVEPTILVEAERRPVVSVVASNGARSHPV